MSKKLLIPLCVIVVLAAVVFSLGKKGVIETPWSPDTAIADSGDADSGKDTKKDKKGNKGKDGEEEETPPVPVELAQAGPRRISAYYRASSVIEADRHVDLVARGAGRVKTVTAEEGAWVEKNEVLAELENDREKIQLRQAELKEAEQRQEAERRQKLMDQNLITEEEFAATRHAFDLAVTERELMAVALEDTRIRAPFAGQVTERKIVPGQYVNPAEPVYTLVDFQPLRVRVHLPEVVAHKVQVDDEVFLDVESSDAPVPARVERISPVVDPATSTVRLTLRVEEDAERLSVGGFVKVRITTDTQTEALSVPKLALVEEGGLRSVFVAEADSVRKIEVRTGLYDDSHIEILDGLESGDYVVTLGQGGLRSGSHVDVLNATDVGWTPPAADEGDGEHAEKDAEEDEDKKDDSAMAMSDEAGQDG